MAPIVLGMGVHCFGCAKKIKKAIKNMPGVESISADVDTSKVTVTGTVDAEALKERLEKKMKKTVTIISDGKEEGGGDERPAEAAPAPPPAPASAGPPSGYGYPYGGYGYGYGAQPPAPARPQSGYGFPGAGYGYGYGAPPSPRHYYPNDAPSTFSDENPNACSVQ